MSVNVTDIQDYLEWRQEVNRLGIEDSPDDFAAYRERVEQDDRVRVTIGYLSESIERNRHEDVSADVVYELLAGVEYRPDDV